MLSAGVPLISVNDHLVELPEIWAGGDGPFVVDDGGAEMWVIGDHLIPVGALGVLADPAVGRARASRIAEMHPAVSRPGARLEAMDVDGVAVQVVGPHVIGFAGERLRFLADGRRWLEACRAYNDYVVDVFCGAGRGRLLAAATVPLHDAAVAAGEAARAIDLGVKAVAFPHEPATLGFASFFGGDWRPLFAVLEEAGIPVLFHIGEGGGPPDNPPESFGAFLTKVNLDGLGTLVDLVYSGVLVDHPRLRVIVVEAGAAWLPYVCERMDFFVRREGAWPHGDRFQMPSEVLGDRVFVSFLDDPPGIRTRHDVGVERMLWQSDFPHGDSFWPQSRQHLEVALTDVPDNEARAIACDNAARLFGINP